jgi:hypothetical protein
MNGKKAKLMRKAGISKKKDKRNYQTMSHQNKGMFSDVVDEVNKRGGSIRNVE